VFEISVKTEAKYLAEESNPSQLKYVFAYQITITNVGDVTAQLLRRHWYIRHAEESIEEVEGEGVVGKQPWLEPGESFQYVSGAVLDTTFGSMLGYYTFKDRSGESYKVHIPEFMLVQDGKFVN